MPAAVQKITFAIVAIVVIALLQLTGFAHAASFTATVIRVADGDTLEVKLAGGEKLKLRLYGIDCPELNQAYGQAAQRFAAREVLQVKVKVQSLETDQYGRTVAIVTYGDKCLNEELVNRGLAWFYNRYCKSGIFCGKLYALELKAREGQIGLWKDKNPVAPWEFRRGGQSDNGWGWQDFLRRLLRGVLFKLLNFAEKLLAD